MSDEPLREKIAKAVKALRLASPEWRRLLDGIRKKAPAEELARLADAAALSGNQLADVCQMVASAEAEREPASREPGLRKTWDKLARDMADAEGRLGKATSNDDREAIASEIETLRVKQRNLGSEFHRCELAAIHLAALRAEGVEG